MLPTAGSWKRLVVGWFVTEHSLQFATSKLVLRDAVVDELGAEWRGRNRWRELHDLISELARLTAGADLGASRWSDLNRHLHFAQANDLRDIIAMDWPSVRAAIERALYEDHEPLPVAVDDLGEVVSAAPHGAVSTKLDWGRLSDDDFEALVHELVRNAPGYENANWLMRTRAADRGRDIEVYRVFADALGETRRRRVIIQCKHWRTRSVNRDDLVMCAEAARLWEGERVDTVIVATSGRFTQGAVELREKRERERTVPSVELWPDNHIELLLARRPHIAASFGLR